MSMTFSSCCSAAFCTLYYEVSKMRRFSLLPVLLLLLLLLFGNLSFFFDISLSLIGEDTRLNAFSNECSCFLLLSIEYPVAYHVLASFSPLRPTGL